MAALGRRNRRKLEGEDDSSASGDLQKGFISRFFTLIFHLICQEIIFVYEHVNID